MPTAIVTPAELVAFARSLSITAQSVAKRKRKAVQLVSDAGSAWKDAKYVRFRKSFDQTVKDLDRFVQLAQEYAQFLERKAALARKYLDNR